MQMIAKELAIDLGHDEPGTLAKAAEAIGKAGINIDGFCETGDGIFHVVTKDPGGARRAVEAAGFRVRGEREVVVKDAPDRPGALADLLRPVSAAKVNVDVAYSLASGQVAIGSDEFAKLKEALNVESPARV